MAADTPVISKRDVFFNKDVGGNRANSSAIMNKFAAQSNFLNNFQTDIKEWKLNGSYGVATGISFFDGVASFFFNSEIVGISFYNGQSGISGITEFDILWKDSSGTTQGSIFSTTPAIDSTSVNETVSFKSIVTNTTVIPVGVIEPIFQKTTFLEGESLFLKLNTAMVTAQNCGLTLFYRPINEEQVI